MKWTKEEARNYLVNYHMINTKSKYSIEDVFERIQSIQFDPLNVVGHNSDLVLQARVTNYRLNDIKKKLYKDRTLLDGWDKQMSIYNSKDFLRFAPVRDMRASASLNGYKKYYDMDSLELIDDVLDIIKNEGPVLSSKIKLGKSRKSKWGASKQSGASIDYLFHKGIIGVDSRSNTQKRYDLMENLLNFDNLNEPHSSEDDFIDWYLLRRIKSLGLCSNRSGVHFSGLHIENKRLRTKHLDRLFNKGLIVEVFVDGIGKLYVPKDALDIPINLSDRISFIAPLDNIVWDRDLMKKLWNFDYIWEVYTPVSKRKWGYYVLPILKGSNIIGRIEFEKYRVGDTLKIVSTQFEDTIRKTKKLEKAMNVALKRFGKYLGASDIQVFEF